MYCPSVAQTQFSQHAGNGPLPKPHSCPPHLQEEASCRIIVWTALNDAMGIHHEAQKFLAGHAYQVVAMEVVEEVHIMFVLTMAPTSTEPQAGGIVPRT